MGKIDFDNLNPDEVTRLSVEDQVRFARHWKRKARMALDALKNQCVATIHQHQDVVKALQKDVVSARRTVNEEVFNTIVSVLATFALTSNAMAEMELMEEESEQ